MKVKCKSIYAGPYGSGNPGETIELPNKIGQALIDSGNGTAVGKPEVETATVEPKETQEKPKYKKRK